MTFDIVLAGVGGQGVLSLAAVIAAAARREGRQVLQSEVHGMSQRGGAVSAHLRIADGEIASALIPAGTARMVLGLEPLESLRHLPWLSPDGRVVTASAPVTNFEEYPPIAAVKGELDRLPRVTVVDAERLAHAAGLPRATNMVLAGAASRYMPIDAATLEAVLRERFAARGEQVALRNLAAFRAGREASS